ncbi:hypothetical protein A2837_02755 [Candidatus Kaiserbacteria bacterium RIFCSPHIGHO2_01_FULL_46_22]|uniref:Metallo-beta-lactamase domain-containing protein n=1 Tax=Candidatus Kaiserbacteria bacterium RIFCSPHIGHO2_01_FULL_46_22 TaxID=1798475 RepID=A0A1F6BX44_9BACT|nr:MAG: hypothetical protein A2837_02755 [Candidatus Kaiserbacteria bacterium RIFCSPHIGHO2_01_FULL_46_22]
MDETLIKRRLVILGTLFLAVAVVWWPEFSGGKFRLFGVDTCDPSQLCVVFLDVGQGDAIFIQSPTGVQMLIDSGRGDNAVLRELSQVMEFSDKDLDYIVATHPDADHIGGFAEVLARYGVSKVIRTENESDTAIWQSVEKAIEAERSEVYYATRGQSYDLGAGVVLEILFPDTDPREMESNTASIVAHLIFGETSLMLTGDSPKAIEEYLVLVEGEHLKSDVLKVGHHGSRTSTSELFLEHVAPTYAVISAGKDNSYGHPHLEVTDLLFNSGVEILSTIEHGQVVIWSDGQVINLR